MINTVMCMIILHSVLLQPQHFVQPAKDAQVQADISTLKVVPPELWVVLSISDC